MNSAQWELMNLDSLCNFVLTPGWMVEPLAHCFDGEEGHSARVVTAQFQPKENKDSNVIKTEN